MPSISTEIWLGSMTLPTAERAWRPRPRPGRRPRQPYALAHCIDDHHVTLPEADG
jgi:hypothetical protein